MLPSDSPRNISTSQAIDVETIPENIAIEIEKELQESPEDLISLVFLLYDVPDTALSKLFAFQRILNNKITTNQNLIHDWVRNAKSRKANWKHELLEALSICQLYGIVKKMGFHIPNVKKHYAPDDIQTVMYVNPVKKALYKLCENIEFDNFNRLKKTLISLNIDVSDYNSCELVILKMMSEKEITFTQTTFDKKTLNWKFNADKLLNIIEKFPDMNSCVKEIKELQSTLQETTDNIPVATSTKLEQCGQTKNNNETHIMDPTELCDIFKEFLEIDDIDFESDNSRNKTGNYVIKNPTKLGTCLIINQENFHLSSKSINDPSLKKVLDTRTGSTVDKQTLERTMKSLNFNVISADDLDHIKMMEFIKNNIKYNVGDTDSIFMLCILSHGVRGHVYAADCVQVNVDDIQNLLDSDETAVLRGIPKVLVIQACQVDDSPSTNLVPDSPYKSEYLKKSDFLIYWATSPEYEAYRDKQRGSIFIQILCLAIYMKAKKEHLYDIFTIVNNGVIKFCTENPKYKQVPIFASTLRKKVYLSE